MSARALRNGDYRLAIGRRVIGRRVCIRLKGGNLRRATVIDNIAGENLAKRVRTDGDRRVLMPGEYEIIEFLD